MCVVALLEQTNERKQRAAVCLLIGKQTFAAEKVNVCYADLAAICCTLHHSLVLTICDFGYDAWQAEISN